MRHYCQYTLIFLLTFVASVSCYANNIPLLELEQAPRPVGNYALPVVQQPGPFFSFGQNIIDQGASQVFLEPQFLKGVGEHFLEITPVYLYGISDNASILFSLPFAADFYSKPNRTAGVSDPSVQMEYAFLSSSNTSYTQEATIVGALSFPVGSNNSTPPTGFGSPTFFIGTTFNRMYENWYGYLAPGITWIAPTEGKHLGEIYHYDIGVGRALASQSNIYGVYGLLELDGIYTVKDRIAGFYDPNSGGNIIFLTPSVQYSTKRFLVQAGFSFPITQTWNGEQNRVRYNTSIILAWTFY